MFQSFHNDNENVKEGDSSVLHICRVLDVFYYLLFLILYGGVRGERIMLLGISAL